MISEATTILIMVTNKAFVRSFLGSDFCESVHVDWFRGSPKIRLKWTKERKVVKIAEDVLNNYVLQNSKP